MYAPHATSLRMGPLGYQSDAQSALYVSYNDLKSYSASLDDALTKRALHALRERGVEYVEVRLMDLDPFCPIGIWPATCRFLDVFLLHCLLADSPPDTPQEIAAIRRNQQHVALRGREPGLKLQKDSDQVELTRWGGQILSECAPIAEALDQARGSAHRDALAAALAALKAPDSLPSARVLHAMARKHQNSFVRFVLVESTLHKAYLQGLELPREVLDRFGRLAECSLERQREIEAADKVPFEAWRQKYLSHDNLVV
jgi:glutamate--cysteine ligase